MSARYGKLSAEVKPDKTRTYVKYKVPYMTVMKKPLGVVYESMKGGRKLMLYKEVYKFSDGDGTLMKVSDELSIMINDFKCQYKEHGVNVNANSLHHGVLDTNVARNDAFFDIRQSRFIEEPADLSEATCCYNISSIKMKC
ncbi:hypothetical protein Tco_1344488 [Tanacetum coccineum]